MMNSLAISLHGRQFPGRDAGDPEPRFDRSLTAFGKWRRRAMARRAARLLDSRTLADIGMCRLSVQYAEAAV